MLDMFEVRVLAVMAEKEILTPDIYPMSLNALTNGCNQVSSRNPVMSLSEATVMEVLQRLMQNKYVAEVKQAGARVVKYEHRLRIKWSLEQDKLAILTVLMLRGWQTAGEIRARSGRLHEFGSVTEVENGLQFLIDKYPPVVTRLELAPGTKEARYAHLLSGDESVVQQEVAASFAANVVSGGGSSRSDLQQEVAQLRDELEQLKQQFADFKRQFE
ncbi:MAG: hypothetical protein RL748_1027 [Pseudomonadota bacterium]|jgi:uncharacterized protein YceH (UPF0502 family)